MNKKIPIHVVAFDMYGTLVYNEATQWHSTFDEIALSNSLAIDGRSLYTSWRTHEIKFRENRTNMEHPSESPAFRTYRDAWTQAFASTFSDLGLEGDPEDATARCIHALGIRDTFSDVKPIIDNLSIDWNLSIISNADDSYLLPVLAANNWTANAQHSHFQRVLSSERARAYKPGPRIFEQFCEEASVTPDQVLYVGDSEYDDAHGAVSAGMHAILVKRPQVTPGRTPTPDHLNLLKADFEVTSFMELQERLAIYFKSEKQ